jgi:integrase/recombinase XerD
MIITELAKGYLALRHASGYQLLCQGGLLMSFGRFADARGDRYVKISTAQKWAALGRTPPQRERRYQLIIRFAKYVREEDSRHEVPLPHVFCHYVPRRTPFIFTPEQLRRIIEQAGKLPPNGDPLRPHTYRTLFGLLAATGCRVSESLALTLSDLTADGLIVRRTKFRKSRLIPLHASASQALDQYLQRRLPFGGQHVFVTKQGGPVPYERVLRAFHRVLRTVGIDLRSGRPRPERPLIHSIRHAFAVRALETCPHDPMRIARHMVALSTYLGHASVSSTYWYLQATPRVMADVADACEALVHREAAVST